MRASLRRNFALSVFKKEKKNKREEKQSFNMCGFFSITLKYLAIRGNQSQVFNENCSTWS